ncbi:hypothetical protein ACVR1I_07545 [Streptococcus cameli]
MFSKQQSIVKQQWLVIALVAVMDLVALLVANSASDSFLRNLFWAFVVLLSLLLIALLLGLRSAKKLQDKIEIGDPESIQKVQQTTVYDERQKGFLLQSYTLGFWYSIFIFWLSIFISRFWSQVISLDFMLVLGLWGGLGLTTSTANLKGASPFVDPRFSTRGSIMGALASLFGLGIVGFSILETMAGQESLSQFFGRGGSGSMIVLGLTLLSMGLSILYRLYQNKKEEEE